MTTIRLVCIVLGGFTSSCLKSIIFLLQHSFWYYYSALAAMGIPYVSLLLRLHILCAWAALINSSLN